LGLNLVSNGESANTYAWMNRGMLSTNMAAWTGSASVSQVLDINAESGGAGSWAGMQHWDGRQNHASTNVWVQNGILHSIQSAKNDGIASAFQIADINGELGSVSSNAGQLKEDASTNYATTYTQINNGVLKTEHIATDDGTASISQESEMTGERGYADSHAGYFVEYEETMGPVFALAVGSVAQLSNGKMSILQTAKDGKSTITSQDAHFIAESGMAYSNLRDADGNYATTYSSMDQGILTTRQITEIDDKARVSQVSTVNGKGGYTTSSAQDANGKNVYTSSSMGNGWLTTMQAAEIDDKATASQNSEVNAERGSSESYAKDGKGNSASTSTYLEKGTSSTEQNAIIDSGVSVSQNLHLSGEYGYAESFAQGAKKNEARTHSGINSGTLTTIQTSNANGKAFVSQESTLEGVRGGTESSAGVNVNGANIQTLFNNGRLIAHVTAENEGAASVSQVSDVIAERGQIGMPVFDNTYGTAYSWITFKQGSLMTHCIAAKSEGRISVSLDLNINAEEASAGSYIRDKSNNLVGTLCDVYLGSLSMINLNAANDYGLLSASGETYITPTKFGGRGTASAYSNSAGNSRGVNYGAVLHAAMRSELKGGVPSADVVVL